MGGGCEKFCKKVRAELLWPLMKARRAQQEAADDWSEDEGGDEASGEKDMSQ